MRKYLPVLFSMLLVGSLGYWVFKHKENATPKVSLSNEANIGTFGKQKQCGRLPHFLKKRGISQPILIDLSQKHYKGLAFLYGRNFSSTLHTPQWERFGHFGTYAADRQGNLYLAPMPFISIAPGTFDQQKQIYRLESETGMILPWMKLDDVKPEASNPYGITSLVYDCDDDTLWVSAIDQSTYTQEKGRIYHIDPKTKKILSVYEGFDALTLQLLHTSKGKYLLAGSAKGNMLNAFQIVQSRITDRRKLFNLSNDKLRIRKVKAVGDNRLQLQTIPFTYTLIAQSDGQDRINYEALFDYRTMSWKTTKQ